MADRTKNGGDLIHDLMQTVKRVTLIEPVVIWIGEREWRCFGLRFPSDATSLEVFERGRQAARSRDEGDVTLLRSRLGAEGEHALLVIDASDDGWYLEHIDWWPGEPFTLHDGTIARMVERRAVLAALGVERADNHFDKGMTLDRLGRLRPL